MSDKGERKKKEEPAGSPAWMTTYADMVTLLLCFFIMLLTMSDINQKKFKQVTATLSQAFGVQRKDPFNEIPSFNSVVKNEYASAENTLVPLDETRMVMDMRSLEAQKIEAQQKAQFESNFSALTEALKAEAENGLLEIDADGTNVVVRIREEVSFSSGSAELTSRFEKMAQKLAASLENVEGNLEISGHTDNLPIRTPRFRNNWDLSSARAASMATYLMKTGSLPPERFTILGHADTLPRADNSTPEGRSKNRRVEILIRPQDRLPASEPSQAQESFDIDKILGP